MIRAFRPACRPGGSPNPERCGGAKAGQRRPWMPANGKNGRTADENPARRMAGICLPALVQMCESGRVKNDGRGISRMSSVNRRIGERCRVGAVVAFAGVMSGCLSPHRTVVADVDPTGWAEPVTVRFANTDTLSACDLRLVVRYDGAFASSAVDLELTTLAPDSLRCTERFTLQVAARHAPAPLMRDTAVLYRRNAVLNRRGEYALTIRPLEPVRGIEAVGLDIVESE